MQHRNILYHVFRATPRCNEQSDHWILQSPSASFSLWNAAHIPFAHTYSVSVHLIPLDLGGYPEEEVLAHFLCE